jgi:hypothetical protein
MFIQSQLKKKISDPRLVESMNAEPVPIKGRVYVVLH